MSKYKPNDRVTIVLPTGEKYYYRVIDAPSPAPEHPYVETITLVPVKPAPSHRD